jgi:dUTP pyrophosphatase
MEIKIKKLNERAVIPKYARFGDAGMDLISISKRVTDKFVEYGTGLAFEIPENYVLLMTPRSSLTKKDLVMKNSIGVLDSGYRGELLVRFWKLGNDDYEIGERIAQVIILPYPKIEFKEVEELSETSRGDSGFGSTGA